MGREINARTWSRSLAATVLIFIISILSIEVVVLLFGSNSWLSPQDEVTHTITSPCEDQKKILVEQDPVMNSSTHRPLKIAVMSSFVPNQGNSPPPRLKTEYFDHLINKACYCFIHNYDFIFNTTYGFDDSYPKWHWIDFGTWHRVPHVAARIRDYDWILYTDTDFAINDIMKPLESFLHEFELQGKTNVQLFLPSDSYDKDQFLFSAFVFMIHNSPFGYSILNYWDMFARGICEKGNLNTTSSGKYTWLDTDQPGLWYAMMRTYADFFPDRVPENNFPQCNRTTGILDAYSTPWNNYFRAMTNLTKGSTGDELAKVPFDQPFVFSSLTDGHRSGLALQLNWGVRPGFREKYIDGAFAVHLKNARDFSKRMVDELAYCKATFGCYAHYNEHGALKIGCGNKTYL